MADLEAGTEAGECAVKRLRTEADGLWVVSDNPVYPPRKLADSAPRHPILGEAMWNLTRNRACR